MIKKGLLVIFIIIILIGVSGCMSKQKSNEPSIKEQVEKYMKDKYNEEFKVTGGGTETWNASYEEIYVKTEKFPNDAIMIRRDKKSGKITDNYMDFLMKDKIEDIMNDIVSKIYPKSKVFYNTDLAPIEGISPQMNPDEYIKYCGKSSHLSLTICISDPNYKENKNDKFEQIRTKFEEKQYSPSLEILYISDDKFALVNESNLYAVLSNYADVANWALLIGHAYRDNKTFRLSSVDWEEVK